MPLVPYGVRAASAGNDDYGIMPLVNYSDGTVTFSEGALDNVTSINGVYFSAAADQSHLLIGSDKRTLTNNNNTGIGILSVAMVIQQLQLVTKQERLQIIVSL